MLSMVVLFTSSVNGRYDHRSAKFHLGSPEIGKMSCGVEKKSCIPFLVELGRVWSGNFGDRDDRDDRVDRIGDGNPPLRRIGKSSCPNYLRAWKENSARRMVAMAE
ncbi:hypothetical protein DPMN_031591 [Dreissena polymorpha]|uniref:Uncharacterized protein n=1 Tax=Dreissena polymorpha TaxID=45954 RepID=A0A9D4M098_DREPO|nr:hypothetical protein DPMN_031591 [Dreissena polymorpha]